MQGFDSKRLIILAALAASCGSDGVNPMSQAGTGFQSTPTGAVAGATSSAAGGGGRTTAPTQVTGAVAGSSVTPTGSKAGSGAAGASAGSTAAGGPTAGATGTAGSYSAGAAAAAGAAAGSSGATGTQGSPVSTAGKLPRVMTTDGAGPFDKVTKVKSTPPGGWLIYPTDIGRDGIKHPLFVFGPGGGTTPSTYESMGMHWDRYGSYGFVIYVLPMSTGDGADMKAGLDWLIKQNDDMSSPLYQKLDTSKICAAGHSQGSVTTFDFMPDDRVTTTIHISGGSFDGMGPSHLSKDTMFLCGPDGNADVATPQCETDFANTKVPTFYTKIQGSSHLTSGRLGWAAVIAWMLWHLADQEDQWKKEFVEPTGQFQMGIYKSQVKNWQ
jgi:hypothetical protein